MPTKRRRALVAEMDAVMRQLIAYAALYQEAVARSAGLTPTDLQCAALLVLEGPMMPSQLAVRAGLTGGGAITAAVDRLARAGLLRRERDDVDRRRVLLTADAAELDHLVGPVYVALASRWRTYLAGLDDAAAELATDVLRHAAQVSREEAERLRAERTRRSRHSRDSPVHQGQQHDLIS